MDFDRFTFYKYVNKDGAHVTVAVASYAGKPVRGIAKCNPSDTYDERLGEELAVARCTARIAEKREARARKKAYEAQVALQKAQSHLHKMNKYYNDAHIAAYSAYNYIDDLMEQIHD